MNRCELANNYHLKGFNCAQSVFAAFCDLTGLPVREALAVSGGFGGGIGGSHEEVCGAISGAISGAIMTLSTLYPHIEVNSPATKKQIYALSTEFQRRFRERFGFTRCGELLAEKVSAEQCKAARELGLNSHCAILIVAAVEIVEEMLREAGKAC
jgi:C_GCAxxG_C_C family probable redox protein